MLTLRLGVKSDPILYRYSYDWLFRLMAEEGVDRLQLGSFVELYHLPNDWFVELRRRAEGYGIRIDSVFTAHRELGGFFTDDARWASVARRNFERLIEVGALLGANTVGSNPGAVYRDQMSLKQAGLRCYVGHMKQLMAYARTCGVGCLTIEPMSCLAEPPTLSREVSDLGDELTAFHREHAQTTCPVGYCADISHGYLDEHGELGHDHMALFEAAIPYLREVHLKNTDARYDSTFGFQPADIERGVVDPAAIARLLQRHCDRVPVDALSCYLEIGGPKLGRDYSDVSLEMQLRESLRYLKEHFIDAKAPDPVSSTASVLEVQTLERVEVGPSMMCVDPLDVSGALRRLEAIGVDYLHLDVMDGRFVPNLPMGMGVIEHLRGRTTLPLDVHLMVEEADQYVEMMNGWGIDRITVHAEACTHVDRTLARIREIGAEAGLALNPATPLEVLDYLAERIDRVLLMTVNPGFAGQKLTPAALRKIADCRRQLDAMGCGAVPIQVDGNVSFANIPAMVAAGADSLVAGTSSIFSQEGGWSVNTARLLDAARQGMQQRAAVGIEAGVKPAAAVPDTYAGSLT